MEKDNEFQEEEQEEEELEEATFSEQEEPESTAPELLERDKVKELVEATNLPKASKARLSEAEYADEEAVEEAVKAEVAYIKAVTGSGKPFGQSGDDPGKQGKEPISEEAKESRFNQIMREIGAREV
jgi:hypothetical protein